VEQIEQVRGFLQQVWDLGWALEPMEWVAILLAILVVQTTLILRSARRRSGVAAAQQFDEITTRLNMVIFELRQIRGAYAASDEFDEEGTEDDSADGPAENFKYAAE